MLTRPVNRIRSTYLLPLVPMLVPSLLALSSIPFAQGSPRIPVGGVGTVPFDPPVPCTCPAWLLGGNLGTNPATQFLGTIDNKTLSMRVFNVRAMQYAFATNSSTRSINVLGGSQLNSIGLGAIGATIAGGGSDDIATTTFDLPNVVNADFGTIGGGIGNVVNNLSATICGGDENTASGDFATIGGGGINIASAQYVTVGGGFANEATFDYDTIGGGHGNQSAAVYTTIGGGWVNVASGDMSTVAGGHGNNTSGYESTICGGHYNSTGGQHATIGGGHDNDVSGLEGTIGGGKANQVSGTRGTIPGGEFNVVQGDYGFAAGQQAEAMHKGAFVWADSTNAPFASSSVDQFSVRAAGGARFFSDANTTIGVGLAPNAGTWTQISDRNAKKDIEPVDGREVLARLADVPISTWSYRGQDGVRHMGPMAQDFYAAFALGLGEKTIDTVDPDGVALAAIQGLNALVREQHDQIAALEARVAELERKGN